MEVSFDWVDFTIKEIKEDQKKQPPVNTRLVIETHDGQTYSLISRITFDGRHKKIMRFIVPDKDDQFLSYCDIRRWKLDQRIDPNRVDQTNEGDKDAKNEKS